MSDIDRRTAIQRLEYIKSMEWRDWAKDALQFAINSLEVDKAYQIMYEGGEISTKANMVAMLTEIQLEIEECVDGGEGLPLFEQGVTNARNQVVEMIQEKIDKLREG